MGLNYVGKKRLLKLAAFLEGLPRKKFYLGSFTSAESLEDVPVLNKECPSTGCAVGWCPAIFPKLVKFDLKEQFGYWTTSKKICVVLKDNPDLCDFDAAEVLFDLSDEQSSYLFDPACYHPTKRGPKSVSARIRQFVKNNGYIKPNTKAANADYC